MSSSNSDRGPQTAQRPIPSRSLLQRSREESGFTLTELLVVILIIGILAAVAIPSFLGSKTKAVDVQAKELVRTAETTAETIGTENGGNYEKVTTEELNKAEPTIAIAESNTHAYLRPTKPGKREYSVTARATDGVEFTITRSSSGELTRKCLSPVTKTGCGGAEQSSW